MKKQLDKFTQAYIEAALWSSTDDNGDPMDSLDAELAPETLEQMECDCAKFQEMHGVPAYNDPYYSDQEKAGHDFWLTRNHHGAGFWDRAGLSEADRDKYTEAAHSFGEFDLYVGDDDKIYAGI